MAKISEFDEAVRMANAALDRPYADPDDDLATISRQFLRTIEQRDRLLKAVRYAGGSLSQSATYEVPPIVVRDVAERMQAADREVGLP